MPRTGLTALAVATTALLACAAPALADAGTPTPVPDTRSASPVPSEAADDRTPADEAGTAPSAVPSQVGVVPRGAADTGVEEPSADSNGTLIGGSATAVVAAAGTAFYVVRRRRATGA
ncbi:sortase-dependent protein [Streptomyces sp. NPDC001858]